MTRDHAKKNKDGSRQRPALDKERRAARRQPRVYRSTAHATRGAYPRARQTLTSPRHQDDRKQTHLPHRTAGCLFASVAHRMTRYIHTHTPSPCNTAPYLFVLELALLPGEQLSLPGLLLLLLLHLRPLLRQLMVGIYFRPQHFIAPRCRVGDRPAPNPPPHRDTGHPPARTNQENAKRQMSRRTGFINVAQGRKHETNTLPTGHQPQQALAIKMIKLAPATARQLQRHQGHKQHRHTLPTTRPIATEVEPPPCPQHTQTHKWL